MVQTWSGLDAVPPTLGRSVVTIGVFDGVHRGHAVVVRTAVELARAAGLPAVAVTFDPHPLAVLRPEAAPPLLTGVPRRAALLGDLGVDAVCVLPFTTELSLLTPEQFVDTVLVGRLHVAAVVVGETFRFGHRAAGDVGVLASLGEAHGTDPGAGFLVRAVRLAGSPEQRWSSTAARARLAEGDVRGAAQVLGRPHRVEGTVVPGDRRGRTLGYPTANLSPDPPASALPGDGVYAGRLVLPEAVLPAAVSVGSNPTFSGVTRRVEAHVPGRDDLELYGRRVGVDFVERLRGMERFASTADLVAAMTQDVARALHVLEADGEEQADGVHDVRA